MPGLLAPITLKNYAGTCGYETPAWIKAVLKEGYQDIRGYAVARLFEQYADPEKKKFVHLVDGGISDNLALRVVLDRTQLAGGMYEAEKTMEIDPPSRLAVIVVNAATEPDPTIDLSAASPSLASLMAAVAGAQIRRYDIETLALLDESMSAWREGFRRHGLPVDTFLVYLSFEGIADPEERSYLRQLPTSFKLSDEQVDRLRSAGRSLLESSSEFQRLVGSFD